MGLAVQREPRFATALLNLALACQKLGNDQKGDDFWKRLLEIDSHSEERIWGLEPFTSAEERFRRLTTF